MSRMVISMTSSLPSGVMALRQFCRIRSASECRLEVLPPGDFDLDYLRELLNGPLALFPIDRSILLNFDQQLGLAGRCGSMRQVQ